MVNINGIQWCTHIAYSGVQLRFLMDIYPSYPMANLIVGLKMGDPQDIPKNCFQY